MLAYVFWHWPRLDADPKHYLAALKAFHAALSSSPPPGYRGSRVFAVTGAPWASAPLAFEDWYFVDDFTALGALEEAAVSGHRREPHDAAARMALGGAGGLYRRRAVGAGATPTRASWFGKPDGTRYDAFLAEVPVGELWQRQLVFGPAPEFCLFDAPPPPRASSPLALSVRLVHG